MADDETTARGTRSRRSTGLSPRSKASKVMANVGGGVDDEGRKWWHVFPLGVCADPTGRAGRIRVYWDTGLRPTPWVRLSPAEARAAASALLAAVDVIDEGEQSNG